jgi:lysophospholipase L1-like esterase
VPEAHVRLALAPDVEAVGLGPPLGVPWFHSSAGRLRIARRRDPSFHLTMPPLRRNAAALLAVAGLLVAAGAAAAGPAQAAARTARPAMQVLVLGDSYSAGNGAGHYTGNASCFRSSRDYAQEYAAILRKHHSQPAAVTDAACSGAVTADFTQSQASGVPPQLSSVKRADNLIFLTIGGNDVHFSDVVAGCLIAVVRSGASCAAALTSAEMLIANGTIRTRIAGVLKAIRAKASPSAKIVLLGYPFLEGNLKYTLTAGKTVVKVGQRLHAIGLAADALDASVVKKLNAGTTGKPFVFISVHKLFDGPPYHGLYADKVNPHRWMVEPFTDAPISADQTWYHPNPAGWLKEAELLAVTTTVPKHPGRS